MCIVFMFYYPRVTLESGLPFLCGYGASDYGFSSEACAVDHDTKVLSSNADLERSFGSGCFSSSIAAAPGPADAELAAPQVS